jgi:hypothetical protein
LFAALIVLVTAFIFYFALGILWLFIGGTECDRGECPPLGEWADDHSGLFTILVATVSLLLGLLLAGAFLRRSS